MGQCFSSDSVPTISVKDCFKNVKCNSECSSSCCMFRSKAKHAIKHKHHRNKMQDNSNANQTSSRKKA